MTARPGDRRRHPRRATLAPDPDPGARLQRGADGRPRAFYDQTLDWRCPAGEDECATLTVPSTTRTRRRHDRARRPPGSGRGSGRADRLAGRRPGRSGRLGGRLRREDRALRHALSALRHRRLRPARCRRVSAPIDCLSDTEHRRVPRPATPIRTRPRRWPSSSGSPEVRRRLPVDAGDLAGHISTVEAAQDMDILRAALGERSSTYLGASYGTVLGATYAELFPDRVGRMVLDGAVDPTRRSYASSHADQAEGFETRCAPTSQDCVERGRLLPRVTPSTRARGGSAPARPDRRGAAPDPVGPRAHGASRSTASSAALQQASLAVLDQGLQEAFERRRAPSCSAGRPLRLARPRRHLHGQLLEAIHADQLPRRPRLHLRPARCPSYFAGVRRRPRRPSAGSSPGALIGLRGTGRSRSHRDAAPLDARAPPRSW